MKSRAQRRDGVIKEKIWGFLVFIVMASLLMPAFSFACSYTFDVSLVSRMVDATRSANNTLGFDNWYIWKYRVDVNSGSTNRSALSHWVLELPNCYITSPTLFQEIEASAGAGGGNEIRSYVSDTVNPDPKLGLSGLKWDQVGGREMNEYDDYDYFWFSVPTNIDINTAWSVKAGDTTKVYGDVEGPACPGGNCDPGTPEPASLSLLGLGLLGLLRRKK